MFRFEALIGPRFPRSKSSRPENRCTGRLSGAEPDDLPGQRCGVGQRRYRRAYGDLERRWVRRQCPAWPHGQHGQHGHDAARNVQLHLPLPSQHEGPSRRKAVAVAVRTYPPLGAHANTDAAGAPRTPSRSDPPEGQPAERAEGPPSPPAVRAPAPGEPSRSPVHAARTAPKPQTKPVRLHPMFCSCLQVGKSTNTLKGVRPRVQHSYSEAQCGINRAFNP